MLKLLYSYISIGLINTAIHWSIFAGFHYALSLDQSYSNLLGFCVAVTFSFFANAHFTFKVKSTGTRYLLFVGFMGAMSLLFGTVADHFQLPGIVTLVSFSAVSLFLGFIYSRYIVFKPKKSELSSL